MAAHRSSQEWSEILVAYQNRNVTQGQFCANYGVSLASLYYQRRKQKQKSGSDSSKLIELPPPKVNRDESFQHPDCQLEYMAPVLGKVKINCSANQLALIVAKLSSAQVYDIA